MRAAFSRVDAPLHPADIPSLEAAGHRHAGPPKRRNPCSRRDGAARPLSKSTTTTQCLGARRASERHDRGPRRRTASRPERRQAILRMWSKEFTAGDARSRLRRGGWTSSRSDCCSAPRGRGAARPRERPGNRAGLVGGSVAHPPRFAAERGDVSTVKTDWTALERALPPGSVWLVLTDCYFADEAEVMALAARVRNAQQDRAGWWSSTSTAGRARRPRAGHGLPAPTAPACPRRAARGADAGPAGRGEGRIDERKRRFDRAAAAGGYERLRWTWPAEADPAATAIFREHFFGQEIVRRLVMPDGAR